MFRIWDLRFAGSSSWGGRIGVLTAGFENLCTCPALPLPRFILHHPVGICITPCRRCVRTNIHQRRNYASGNTNPDVDAVFAAAVKNVQNPRICGRRQVLSAIMTLFRVYALPGTAVTNSNSQVDAVFKPLRGRCLQSPSCISSLVRRCRGVSRYRHCVGAPRGELLIPDQTM